MNPKKASLEALYDQHIDAAVRLGYLLTGDRQLAQDLAHDAFVRLFSRFRDLRSPDAFGAYLRRTLVNLTRDHHRRGLLRGKHQRAVAPEALDVELPDLGLRQDLWNALMRLPHRQRAAVVLRYYQDLTESQVAEVLGCSPGAAKSLLARGMNSLRTIVKEMELN